VVDTNHTFKLAIAQINAIVGDLEGNRHKIEQAAQEAFNQGANLLLTPELCLTGYPPEDLVMRRDFNEATMVALKKLAQDTSFMTLIVGHPHIENGHCYNAASILKAGKVFACYHKQALPNHSVFDEVRYFKPGEHPLVFEHAGVQCGVLICADIWESMPANLAKQAGAEVLLVLNASPYHMEKQETRYQIAKQRVFETELPLVYCNLVGGQDELVFDGASFVLNDAGEVTQELPAFKEGLALMSLSRESKGVSPTPALIESPLGLEESVYEALKLGLYDYVTKNGFKGVVLGLSGGIDSALTLAIAYDALGPECVHAVMMPSEYTADISVSDAKEMVSRLGVRYSELPISPLFNLFRETLADEFAGLSFDATEENLQARIRGMLLMALSNKFGTLVITTGNKSEMAVGYSTLYGDMAGGFALIKDVPKTLVYRLATYRNRLAAVIPERIISRPPSAELKPDQKDQDSLPPYDVLDGIMEAYVEHDLSRADMLNMGFNGPDIDRVTSLIDRNEYKRSQAPIGVRITQRGFGKDRRYPITTKFVFKS
jgi:NAD+ synthase (glutamine-hydrolysing)